MDAATGGSQAGGARLAVLKVIGWLLVAAALVLLGRDLVEWIQAGRWVATSGGKAWYSVSPGSLNLVQAVIERHIWKPLWSPVLWVLLQPVWLALAVPGLVLAFLPRRNRRRRRFGRWRG